MTKEELNAKMNSLMRDEIRLLHNILEPARAAANQMKDAGMHAGVDRLNEVLFAYDAWVSEVRTIVSENIQNIVSILIAQMKGE